MPSIGRILHGIVAVGIAAGGYLADWNHTHVFNPRWPPHAKFHNGQTMTTGLLLGATALYLFARPLSNPRESLDLVSWILTINCVAMLSAAAYPGSLPVDPEFGDGFPQAYMIAGLFVLILAGNVLERARISRMEGEARRKENLRTETRLSGHDLISAA